MEKICRALHCTPNDLLAWEPGKHETLEEKHPLNRLRRKEEQNVYALLRKIPLEDLPTLGKLIQERVDALATERE